MFDWIIEADIYRLKKAAAEASTVSERHELELQAEHKARLLVSKQRDPSRAARS